jgi:hypothetical protein
LRCCHRGSDPIQNHDSDNFDWHHRRSDLLPLDPSLTAMSRSVLPSLQMTCSRVVRRRCCCSREFPSMSSWPRRRITGLAWPPTAATLAAAALDSCRSDSASRGRMMVKGLFLSKGTPAPRLADLAHLADVSSGHLQMLHAAKCSQPWPADPRVEDLTPASVRGAVCVNAFVPETNF